MKKMKTKTNRPGKIIHQQMIEAGLSVHDLAYLMDKSYAVVYYIVRAREDRLMTLDFAQRCAAVFDVDPRIYLHQQADFEVEKNPLDADYKKSLRKRWKELEKIKALSNKHHGGRKWTSDC